jgi:hypothetical protein
MSEEALTGLGGRGRGLLGRRDPWLAAVCLLAVAAAVVVVVLGSRLSFFNDDWYFLLQRPGLESGGGLDSLLAPHNSNLVALTAMVYKVMVLVFGLSSQVPYRLVLGGLMACLGILLYRLISPRAGTAFGLAAAAVVMFLGSAWEDLLFFASIDLIGSLVLGLAALVALERDTPRRNAIACLMLVGAVAFSNVGIAFVVAAAVCVLLRRRPGQLWIPAIALALFAAWWVADGTAQPSHISLSNVEHLPGYLVDSAASGLASMTGLNRGGSTESYTRGKLLLLAAVIAIGIWMIRGGRPHPWVLVPLSAALTFWVLTGASFFPGREPLASRYQLIDVTLLALIGAELLPAIRVDARRSAVVLVLATAVITSNITGGLAYGFRFLRDQAGYVKADLGVLTTTRGLAPSRLRLTQLVAHNAYLSGITIGRYFEETRAHGAPSVDSIQQVAGASAQQRRSADGVLATAEHLTPVPAGGAGGLTDCTRIGNQPGAAASERALQPGINLIRNSGPAGLAVGVRRFAPPGLPVYISLIAPGTTQRLLIPPDAITTPWHLLATGATSTTPATIQVCRHRP